MDIYKEIILDHYRNPKNFGSFENATSTETIENLSCGDILTMSVKIENDVIEDIRFSGKGCAISVAGASLLTEYVKKKPIQEIQRLTKEDMIKILGTDVGIVRIKCALLPLETLHKVIKKVV
ncbi:MAG: SUF system NifU family Fe-S cluster assembly protein [Candidatus Moraniibacteriota bacterium]|nr:MAG: SUF system NifU family Fe-S cluster assembly protein [Candidatus Moranbacteria bacterium]